MSAYDIIRLGVADVDAVNRQLAVDISDDFAQEGDDPIKRSQARKLLRKIKGRIKGAYGATRNTAIKSAIYLAITRNTDLAAQAVIYDFLRSLEQQLADADKATWDTIASELLDGGTGPDDEFARAYISMRGFDSNQRRLERSGLLDPNRRWVNGSGYRLSDRVWASGEQIRRMLDKTLMEGVRRGEGPITIARRLEGYLNPDYAPVRYESTGRIIRIKLPGRVRGGGANAARVLARTEIQQMHHAATIVAVDSIDIDGAGIKWALSPSHPRIDICDSHARGSSRGFPRGVYTTSELPGIPHPQCLCSKQPWMPSRDEVLRQLTERYAPDTGTRG
jgi:hypothetical protein